MLNLRSLEIFYWVATLNSFHKAAARVHATQSTVSHRIATFEGELGVTLFDRTSRSVRLTPHGRTILEYAERFLALESELLSAIASPGQFSGVVRLGVAETIVHTWLTDFIEETHRKYLGIVIDIVVDISPALRESLRSGEIDMAFLLAGPGADADFIEKPLCKYPVKFIVSPDLELGEGPLTPANLSRYPIITLPKRTHPYVTLRDAIATRENPSPRIFANWSLSTIVKMAVDKIGIAVMPLAAAHSELDRGTLIEKESTLVLEDFTFCSAYPRAIDVRIYELLTQIASDVSGAI
ncbi:LysR family transcriptional regulator [Paraburkholderia dipogonis]|uniref:LysR family transcriptional regulator n=2 Tax=Paraburkholderia dipogonis TaxID=1211383 RepID=A0A4Y8MKG2_9BURK|nr:LysR family transcriptional regulator [Paraburkholderia dipogonis]